MNGSKCCHQDGAIQKRTNIIYVGIEVYDITSIFYVHNMLY